MTVLLYSVLMRNIKIDTERMLYIEAYLLANGSFGRDVVCSRFNISKETATVLIKLYQEQCPEQMVFDKKPKRPRFVKTTTCKPCLFQSLTEAQRYLKLSSELNAIIELRSKTNIQHK